MIPWTDKIDVISNYIRNHKGAILEGIIIAIVTGFLGSSLHLIVGIIKTKFLQKTLPEPKELAIYLSSPQKSLNDNCIGRDELLEKVFDEITNGKKMFLVKKCIAIKGEEGIGKTLFCYSLFKYYLQKCSVYLGWIECNGKQSIFDIIKNTFEDSRFHRKSKDKILNAFNSMNKACILFVDQIDQFTPLDELEELSQCSNIILILSGLLRRINFVNSSFTLPKLSNDIVRTIFEKQSNENYYLMDHISKKSVKCLLESYAKGNPFLTIAFAKAKCHYNGRWDAVLQNMQRREYSDENYLKNILRQLYKINELEVLEKDALSKLSIIEYTSFVEFVFELLNISAYYVERLCNTYWLVQEDSICYSMDKTHREIIIKILTSKVNLKNAIISIGISLFTWTPHKDKGFRWISLYVEDILRKVQGYEPNMMEEEVFSHFAYQVACKYETIGNDEKSLEWIKFCRPQNGKLVLMKTCIELRVKAAFLGTLFSFYEIEQGYSAILEKEKTINSFEGAERYLIEEYCLFLIRNQKYKDAILLCKKYFEVYDMKLSDPYNCDMYCRYLQAANESNDEESLRWLVNEAIIQELYKNEKNSITVAWSFGELGKIFIKRGDRKNADIFIKHMIVLLNKERGFCHNDIKNYLKISDEEFVEYVHSCDELLNSLNEALEQKDAEALYIEGCYQEKRGNFDAAFALYEEAASRDSLSGMCALAFLYYRGQGEPCNYDKAHMYWGYCCERGHRGSYYWLGMLLLDTNYNGCDRDLALKYLIKAAALGNEQAKQKLREL